MAKRSIVFEDAEGDYRLCTEAKDQILGEPFVYLELPDCYFEAKSMGAIRHVCVRLNPHLAGKLGLLSSEGDIFTSTVEERLEKAQAESRQLKALLAEALTHLKTWVPTNPFEEESADVQAVEKLRLAAAVALAEKAA